MNHTKHLLIMLACCLVPLALILAVSIFGLSLGALQPLVPFALVLLCPLMMLMMMRGMGHDHGNAQPPTNAHTAPTKSQVSKEITPHH
ncbi:MAG: DUF2933 domain-containing protein [Chloroflexi bacterium]|nr:DUF2933 domain-containing protein [Chloroflexota bacterium]